MTYQRVLSKKLDTHQNRIDSLELQVKNMMGPVVQYGHVNIATHRAMDLRWIDEQVAELQM